MQWAALAGGVLGSSIGLLFGLLSLNRPLLNALVFYVGDRAIALPRPLVPR